TLPNTNNALVGNTQAINNPPRREGRVAELPYFYGGNQDPVAWLEDFTRACNANGIANGQKLEVVPAYLRGVASTWWNANQALPYNNQNRITAWTGNNNTTDFIQNFPATFRTQTLELYRRVETNAFAYPEAIKARKFVNGLLPDLYITVKPHNDQTWNGAVDQTKAYELTHQDQGADLIKQVQTLSYRNRGNRNNNGPQFTNQQTSGQMLQSSNRPNQYVCYTCEESRHVVRTCPNKNNNSSHSPVAGSIGATRRWGESIFKLRGVPHEGECTRQTTIPSNLTLLEAYPAIRTTQSKARLDPTAGIVRDKPTEEETILRTVQGLSKVKQPTRTTETKKVEPKKIIKKKPAAVAPIYKMVEPYTPQQFFDQKANITNVRAKDNEKNSIKKNNEVPDDKNTLEVDDLIQVANTTRPNANQTSALYCEVSIKHIKFLLIVDSGSARSIISLSLLKDLDMEITKASKTVMVNVNGERRRLLGAVTDISLRIHNCIIPMDAIVTDANSHVAIVSND
ncbi:hypothetical protein RclHR1_24530001, partial [Rhizophagus clarus]